jgi:single-stranded DNA-specific DHH superfamily exonuclease
MRADFQATIKERQPRKVLVLHHWDTDGLACAAMLLDAIEQWSPATEVALMHPTINNYFLTMTEYEYIHQLKVDVIVTVDINFPLDVIERLEEAAQTFVFDHHAQTANIQRPGVQSTMYPGCSMLLNDYLMQPLSLVSVLGMVGDLEDRIKDRSDFYPQVEEMMKQHGLTFDQIQRITKLIDTMYMVGDDEGLEYAITLLRRQPADALIDARLLEHEQELKEAMAEATSQPMQEVGPHIRYMPIESEYSLTSEVTRAKSRQYPDHIIVTDQRRGEDATLYVRRRRAPIDLGCVVDAARAKGYNSGGKPEVAGVVLPAHALDAFRQEVFALLMQVLPV